MNTSTPSIPPSVTWPMVFYAFVKELPYPSMTMGGAIVAIVLIVHGDGSALERLGAVIAPAIISALARSKPTESSVGLLGMLAAFVLKKRIGL